MIHRVVNEDSWVRGCGELVRFVVGHVSDNRWYLPTAATPVVDAYLSGNCEPPSIVFVDVGRSPLPERALCAVTFRRDRAGIETSCVQCGFVSKADQLCRHLAYAAGELLAHEAALRAVGPPVATDSCHVAAQPSPMPHPESTYDLPRADWRSNTAPVAGTALSTILDQLPKLPDPAREVATQSTCLGLGFAVVHAHDDIPRLGVLPFTCPGPRSAYRYGGPTLTEPAMTSRFSELDRASRTDLLSLCGLPPYPEPRPIATQEERDTMLKIMEYAISARATEQHDVYARARYRVDLREPIRQAAKPRAVNFSWSFGKDQVLTTKIGRRGGEICFCGDEAWLLGADGQLAKLNVDPQLMLAVMRGMRVTHAVADTLDDADIAVLRARGIPAPWRPSRAERLDGTLNPRDVLRVVRDSYSYAPHHGVGIEARLGRRYGAKVPASARRIGDRMVAVAKGRLVSLPVAPDDHVVDAAVIATRAFERTRRGRSWMPIRQSGQSWHAAWLNALEIARHAGIEVTFAPGTELEPTARVDDGALRLELSDAQDRRGYEIGAPVTVAGRRVDLASLLGTVASDERFTSLIQDGAAGRSWAIDLPGGDVLSVPADELQRLIAPLVEWLRVNGGKLPRMSALQAATLGAAVDVSRCNRVVSLRRGIERLVSTPTDAAREPPDFKGTLRPYQRVGLGWLNRLSEAGFGGVLADDMGLGKTVQVIAHLLALKRASALTSPALVICPTSVTVPWEDAARQFAPDIRVLRISGDATARAGHIQTAAQHDLVITSYAQFLRDAEAMKAHSFDLMILDEAQQVKNGRAKTAAALRALQAKRVLVVTGTPIENNLGEFRTLFDYALPGALGDEATFRKFIRNPIEKHNDTRLRAKLTNMVAPFVLRRLKSSVARDLPTKTEKILRVDLDPPQRQLYEQLRSAGYARVQNSLADKGLLRSRITILDALLKLRQVCDDPRLVKLASAHTVKNSCKLDALMQVLEEVVASERHALVFSGFTEMLNLIEPELDARGIAHVRLSGDTRDRVTPVARFQAGKVPVFLISLKAGGVGLNLTAADTVVHYDPWWNPAAENQATDRAHRIGQTQPVLVYKLVCAATLEEHILTMQARKAELARAILDGGAVADATFTEADIDALFAPRPQLAGWSARG
ncbi:MAG TPA: DEAD/DEAH box helicase [Nevskiaceae bacterium]|nr:DEAD/DEAH box helicase [Nevskiaceae bacterium]